MKNKYDIIVTLIELLGVFRGKDFLFLILEYAFYLLCFKFESLTLFIPSKLYS